MFSANYNITTVWKIVIPPQNIGQNFLFLALKITEQRIRLQFIILTLGGRNGTSMTKHPGEEKKFHQR